MHVLQALCHARACSDFRSAVSCDLRDETASRVRTSRATSPGTEIGALHHRRRANAVQATAGLRRDAIRCIYSYPLAAVGIDRRADFNSSPAPARACVAPRARSRSSTTTRSRRPGLRTTQFGAAAHAGATPDDDDQRRSPRRCCSIARRCRATSIRSSARGLVAIAPGIDLRTRQLDADRGGQARARRRRAALGRCAARRLASRRQATPRRALRAARGHRAPASRTARSQGSA